MNNYALEEKDGAKPSGSFKMDEKQTKEAGKKVLMAA